MSSDIVIRAENLGKKYIIGHQSDQERYTALRDVIGRNIRNLARSARDMVRGRQLVVGDEVEEFWALRDVNFEIKRGDVVGIIGRNGAGKSTLLKILSRITEPSSGRVEIRGRVASLLEVGTGFHPELTGRENIYLNGAILGMTRAEIKRKFDEIVDFAGVEKFLDTPVKRYSSGMYVRLAFAVAAHLEPEILVVDEVLAVGDAEFQKKCLGKMKDVTEHGRTVLFVSHNMGAINLLCSRAILFKDGHKELDADTHQCVNAYLSSSSRSLERGRVVVNKTNSDVVSSVRFELLDAKGNALNAIETFGEVRLRLVFESTRSIRDGGVVFFIYLQDGQLLSKLSTRPESFVPMRIAQGRNVVECKIKSFCVSAGYCVIGVGITIPGHEWLFNEPCLAKVDVVETDVFNSGNPPRQDRYPVPMVHEWVLKYD